MEINLKGKIAVILIVGLLISSAESTEFMGGRGLFYTQSALINSPGMISVNMFSRAYYKICEENNITNGTIALAMNFGLSRHVEIAITQLLYQDLVIQKNGEQSQYPDDTFLRVKIGNYYSRILNNPFFYGLLFSLRYRTGDYDNVYLEPYADYAICGRFDAIFSYYWNPRFPEESPAVHANLGYINYNDGGSMSKHAQSIPFSVGYVNSNLKREYSIELHGLFFTRRPAPWKFSREHYIYLEPGFKYKLYKGLAIGVGLDILVYAEDEKTAEWAHILPSDYPQYPGWRLNIKFDYVPSTGFYRFETFEKIELTDAERETLQRKRIITNYKSLFEWVISDDKSLINLGLDLEQIRDQREEAEKELEKLSQEIEGSE